MNGTNYFFAAVFAIGAAGGASLLYVLERDSTLAVVGNAHVHVTHTDRKQPLVVDFVLKNHSNDPIVIDSVTSACSCVTSDVGSTMVPAGGSTTVSVTIGAFDSYGTHFMQQALVRWSDRHLKLTISGTVPPSDKVLYRPTRLTLRPSGNRLSGWLVARIPKHCGGESAITLADVVIKGLPGSEVVVESLGEAGLYREYRIVVSSRKGHLSRAIKAEMTIITPCEQVLVPIVIDL